MTIPHKGLKLEFPDAYKAIRAAFALNLRDLMDAYPDEFRGFYNPPSLGQARMLVINRLVGGLGVEAVHADDDGLYGQGSVAFEYVNTGDTYSATVIRWPGGRYEVSTMGDAVERLERRGVSVK